ncbi:GAF domain-containing protein [Chitinimonas sp.]|uniref:GAF domain-containing protein n=1 Tax=Chitinimonas sp. TaxID=1934313 RepID=UPI0035AE9BFD
MELFADDDALPALEAALAAADPAGEFQAGLALAWQLRQRDPQRAAQLAARLHADASQLAAPAGQLARLQLLEAELHCLHGRYEASARAIAALQPVLANLDDALLCGDACLLQARLLGLRGEPAQASLEAAIDAYHKGGDTLRQAIAAAQLRYVQLQQGEDAPVPPEPPADSTPAALACWQRALCAAALHRLARHGEAAAACMQAVDLAEAVGDRLSACRFALAGSEMLLLIGAAAAAQRWARRALAIAAPLHNPQCIAAANTALAQSEGGASAPAADSQQIVIALEADFAQAQAMQQRARLSEIDQLKATHAKQQHAASANFEGLLAIGQEIASSADSHAVFESLYLHAQGLLDAYSFMVFSFDETGSRRTLVYGIEDGRPMPGFSSPVLADSAIDRCFRQRRTIVANKQPGEVPQIPGTRETLSLLYAPLLVRNRVLGAITVQSPRPHAYGPDALAVFDALSVFAAIALASAEMRRLTEEEIAEQTSQLLLSNYELNQAIAEQAASADTLRQLGDVGRDITAALEAQVIVEVLHQHTTRLLDSQGFALYRLDDSGKTLSCTLAFHDGVALPSRQLALDAPEQVAEVARERSERLLALSDSDATHPAGLRKMKSALYAPLIVGERLLGVLTIQAARAHAYGQREQMIFRTLCAYGAIALANADAYRAMEMAVAERTGELQKVNEGLSKAVKELLLSAETLRILGDIGREITATLDVMLVFETLHRHVGELLDAPVFSIYRHGDTDQAMLKVYGGALADAGPSDPDAAAVAEAVATRSEILIEQAPGDMAIRTRLFAPLQVQERVLGVMSIQSTREHAYGERERMIFRTLCAYGAIALANGDAYRAAELAKAQTVAALHQLTQTQTQLVQQEKMATLGQLVANVAHEINTPIAAIKSGGQSIVESLGLALGELPPLLRTLDEREAQAFLTLLSLQHRLTGVLSSSEERALVRAMLLRLHSMGIDDARRVASALVQCRLAVDELDMVAPLLRSEQAERMLSTAASLAGIVSNANNINVAVDGVARIVFALKSYTRQSAANQARETDLAENLETVLTLYSNRIKQGSELIKRFSRVPPLLAFPDELRQVWTNLIHNALHAMQYRGTLTVRLFEHHHHAVVEIEDTGCGIAPDIRSRIFEPFFTTKPEGEGSGLGLDIVRKIVRKHLGRIVVRSEPGLGSTFTVILPLQPAQNRVYTDEGTAVAVDGPGDMRVRPAVPVPGN